MIISESQHGAMAQAELATGRSCFEWIWTRDLDHSLSSILYRLVIIKGKTDLDMYIWRYKHIFNIKLVYFRGEILFFLKCQYCVLFSYLLCIFEKYLLYILQNHSAFYIPDLQDLKSKSIQYLIIWIADVLKSLLVDMGRNLEEKKMNIQITLSTHPANWNS